MQKNTKKDVISKDEAKEREPKSSSESIIIATAFLLFSVSKALYAVSAVLTSAQYLIV